MPLHPDETLIRAAPAVPEGAADETEVLAPVPPGPRDEGAWRIFPFEGALEIRYQDAAGNLSRRRVMARELKVGPGKTLLGGIDMATDGYRGFRADRIEWILDAESGQIVDRNIVDWLLGRALTQEKERRRLLRKRAA